MLKLEKYLKVKFILNINNVIICDRSIVKLFYNCVSKQFVFFFFYKIMYLWKQLVVFLSIVKDEKNWKEFYADTLQIFEFYS